MLEIQVESQEVLTALGYICAAVGVLFTLAIMFEKKSTKRKKEFNEQDLFK